MTRTVRHIIPTGDKPVTAVTLI